MLNKTIQTYNELGENYIEETFKLKSPKYINNFIKLLPSQAYILDAGCGAGRDSKFFSEKGFEVLGIDASTVFIKYAKKIVPKAKFKIGDIRKIKIANNSFHAIWAQAVLLHLKRVEVQKVLLDFYKILKPEGILHVTVKQGKGEEILKDKMWNNRERFFTYFTKEELVEKLKKAKFEIIYSKIRPDVMKRKNVKWITIGARKVV